MLKDNLYTIVSLENKEGDTYTAQLTLDPGHEIFKGHFPGQAVLPGVCLLEMLKEIVGEIKEKPCRVLEASAIKYLRLVDPNADPVLQMEISLKEVAAGLQVNASSFLQDGTPNFKFKGTLA